MTNLKVYEKQSMLDITVQHSGGIDAIFDLAFKNGLSITDDLSINDTLQKSELVVDSDVVEYYLHKGIISTTAPQEEDLINYPIGGISYMGIETDFKVS
jgi:hypothetical protein